MALRVDKDARISKIIQDICDIKEVNIDSKRRSSSLVLFSQIKGIIRGIFNPELLLSNYNLINNEIEAYEVLNNKGRDMVREFYQKNPDASEMLPTAHLSCLLKRSHKPSTTAQEQQLPQNMTNQSTKPSGSTISTNSIKARKRQGQSTNASRQ